MSARKRIEELFLNNISRVITKEQISEVAQINEWARRVRELRDEFGYEIKSHKDEQSLKPGEYILHNPVPSPKAKERKISKDQYFRILHRDGHKCLSCGRTPVDKHPTDESRTIKLVVDHVYPISDAEKYAIDPYSDENLQTLCDFCNEGKWNKYSGKLGKAKINLTAMVRHAPRKDQLEVFEMLKKVFG
ncbi:Type-2 restriction enzyme KpnI [Pseudoalteromonas sp. P1-9]|uniref:HNH endonuclease n=1 Tax=Pseudoalteromonas sp. P1-9 TaxID=1710354 RepID=UPI0006D61EF3|nr:HNH endonuclease [Pseudoalteromonas sp. P1-9]KPV94809.1 Type-2 restriction enzyme KpnI [Pseudoalteromonas sp. P1-9]